MDQIAEHNSKQFMVQKEWQVQTILPDQGRAVHPGQMQPEFSGYIVAVLTMIFGNIIPLQINGPGLEVPIQLQLCNREFREQKEYPQTQIRLVAEAEALHG